MRRNIFYKTVPVLLSVILATTPAVNVFAESMDEIPVIAEEIPEEEIADDIEESPEVIAEEISEEISEVIEDEITDDAAFTDETAEEISEEEELAEEAETEVLHEEQEEEVSAETEAIAEASDVDAIAGTPVKAEQKEEAFTDVLVSMEAEAETESPVKVLKEDGGEFKMFVISGASLERQGDEIRVNISTTNVSFDGIYFGSKDDEVKEPVMTGNELPDNGGFTFSFKVPAAFGGQKKEIALRKKKDGSWYTNASLFMTIPEVTGPAEPEEPKEDETTDAPEDQKAVENGIYQAVGTTNAAMFKIVDTVLTSKNGKMTAVITLSGTGYDYLYMGTKEEAYAADEASWIPAVIDENGKYTYEIPVEALDMELPVASRSARYAEEGRGVDAWINRTVTISSEGLEKIGEVEDSLPDGIYEAVGSTNAAMFKIVNTVLTSKNGKMTAVITLSGTGYDYLYMGTKEEAYAADEASWIPAVIDENGKYTYEIPVEALDTELPVASRSARYAEEGRGVDAWINRTVTISSEGLKKIAELPGEEDPEDKPEDNKPGNDKPGNHKPGNNNQNTNKPGSNTNGGVITIKPEENDGHAENESHYTSDLSGSTASVNSNTTLADGVYTPDAFSWSGGTGKVNLLCDKVTVKNGQAYATIAFTSTAYSYVKTNGRTYYSTVSDGKSWVTIPVELNKNYKIIGMTTKMSAAHEIEYSIFVYLAAASGKPSGGVNGIISTTNEALDEEAPVIMGLEYESETELAHAEHFKLYNYEDGIVLLEIDMTGKTARDPEMLKEEAGEEAEEEEIKEQEEEPAVDENGEIIVKTQKEICADLYMGNVVKYLIVPADVVIPVGLDKEMIVVTREADEDIQAFAASLASLPFMKELELLDSIAALGLDQEELSEYPELLDRITEEKIRKEGEIVSAGTLEDIDYKALIRNEINLAFLDSSILPREPEEDAQTEEELLTVEEQITRLSKTADHFAILGVPLFVDRSADEKTEIASYEWIKVFGAIYGVSEQADQLFEKAVKDYEKKQN